MTAKVRIRLSPDARREQLLATAKKMIVDDGLQRFTMEALARTADVTSPLVYNYYSSRELLLQALLEKEFCSYADKLAADVSRAKDFAEVARVFITIDFDHYAPGKILPILLSQPEIASTIQSSRDEQARKTADFLAQSTAENFHLTTSTARLLVRISSGVAIAAAEHYSLGKVGRKKAIDTALSYILAGIEKIANQNK